ncbi:Spo0E family sporulation regulatory protein-aspartic acid phosphatase [Sporomusa aerivorans]
MDQIAEIEAIIEKLRIRLHDTARGKCFTDPEVVRS